MARLLMLFQPVGEFCQRQDGNVELRLDRLNVTVATDQCVGPGDCRELKKDDVVSVSDVGQTLGCGSNFDGLDIGQEFRQ